MPDNFPTRYDNPRMAQLWADLGTEKIPWVHTPRFGWACTIDYTDITGPAATQTITIVIGAGDFVTGRLVVAFAGGGLGSPVSITADAPVGDDENDLGDTLTTAIDTAIATSLAGVVASVSNATANEVVVVLEQGIGFVTATPTFTPAQQTTVTWGGTLVDGEYSVRIECDDPNADVTIDNDRASGTPANVNAMAAAFETAAETLIATTLAGVLVSADDSGAVNTLIFEPGVEATVTATVTNNTTHTYGGTTSDGDYVTRFDHADLPGGSVTITVNRSGAETDTDLADDFEGQVEAHPLLQQYVQNANNTAGANIITTWPGTTGLNVVAVSDPGTGTLTVSDPTVVVADATPAGPDVTATSSVTIDLNTIAGDEAFPLNVLRQWCLVHVTAAFGAGRTLTVGDANEPAGVLGSTPIDINTTGRSGSLAADAEYQPRTEAAWVPTATIDLGASTTLSAGSVLVEVLFTPNLVNAAA